MHVACHARAQNMGNMGAEMLRLIPETDVAVIERCSGHGGSWGVKKGNFEIASKFSRQTVKRAADAKKGYLASECPLAGKHLAQGFEKMDQVSHEGQRAYHPIEILAKAYGF
jgi:glycerol-3-phosphate dehydrogenase subunit C